MNLSRSPAVMTAGKGRCYAYINRYRNDWRTDGHAPTDALLLAHPDRQVRDPVS